MKIILCKGQFLGPISGADETIVTYATQLKKAGHDPYVLTLYTHPSDAQYQEPLVEAGVKVIHLSDSLAHRFLAMGREAARRLSGNSRPVLHKGAERMTRRIANLYFDVCRRFLARANADIVHVLTPDAATPVLISAAHAVGLPVVYQEMGTPYYSAAHEPYYERLVKALPLCSEVAALSPSLANLCRERYRPKSPVSVLPIMVEDMRNGHVRQPPEPDQPTTFGFAARFDEMKGSLTLLKAFAQVNAKLPSNNIHLKMAGEGPQAAELEKQIRNFGIADRVHLPGTYTDRQEKMSFFTSVDVFVQPSMAEGTPNSIVEAMSFGVPIIASLVGGVPEVVSPDAGILVPPGAEAALADAIERLASDPDLRARMGRAARARYERFFTPETVMPIMVDTYSRVAQRGNDANSNRTVAASASGASAFHAHPWMLTEHAQ